MNFGRQVQIFEILEFDWLILARVSIPNLAQIQSSFFAYVNLLMNFFSGTDSKVNCTSNVNKKYRSNCDEKLEKQFFISY